MTQAKNVGRHSQVHNNSTLKLRLVKEQLCKAIFALFAI